jgi:hypothetical protein
MVPQLFQSVAGELADEADVGLQRCSMVILIGTLVALPIEALRIATLPGSDLVGVYPYPILFGPGFELLQTFLGVVGADSGASLIVPGVNPADQVIAPNKPVRHEGTPMQAAPVEHRDLVIDPHHDEIDPAHHGMGRSTILELAPNRDLDFLHPSDLLSAECCLH